MTSSVNTGIDEGKRMLIAAGLAKLLAETYTLYLKTQKYHWNVTGPQFHTLHSMFEAQYLALAKAVDDIAERIRVLGLKAPGSWSEFSRLSTVQEDVGLDTSAEQMISYLLADHEQAARSAKAVLPLLEGANDEGSHDLLTERIAVHEKTAWMLRSISG